MTTKKDVLRNLGNASGESVMIAQNQNVRDIINLIKIKHIKCVADYDRIADFFYDDDLRTMCEKLWKWCKKNIRYEIESEDVQTVSQPSVILARGTGDCKHYSLFIAGVLDALKRKGHNIDWRYRFASYNIADATPGHVFVVVNDHGTEIWIDPVLDAFDYHKKFMCAIDKKISTFAKPAKMNGINAYQSRGLGLSRLRGHEVLQTTVGATTAETGALIQKVSPALAVVPVVGWAAAAVGELAGFFLSTFGNKYTSSTKARWLAQAFDYYVKGQANVTSDNKVSDADVPVAQNWFAITHGVPIYDICRWHDLRGEDCNTGRSLNISDQQAAANFAKNGDIQQALATGKVTMAQINAAVKIAKSLQYGGNPPGSWAKQTAAPSLIDYSSESSTAPKGSLIQPVSTMNAGFFSDLASRFGIPEWLLVGGVLFGGYMLVNSFSSHKRKTR